MTAVHLDCAWLRINLARLNLYEASEQHCAAMAAGHRQHQQLTWQCVQKHPRVQHPWTHPGHIDVTPRAASWLDWQAPWSRV